MRFYRQGDYALAVVELTAIINAGADSAAAYILRAQAEQERRRYADAVSDYVRVVVLNHNLNKRNAMRVLQHLLVCISMLTEEQKLRLNEIFRQEFGVPSALFQASAAAGAPLHYIPAVRQRRDLEPRTGRIVNIGKFLLDAQDVKKLEQIFSQTVGIRTLTTYRPAPDQTPVNRPRKGQAKIGQPPRRKKNEPTPGKFRARSPSSNAIKRIDALPAVIGSCVIGHGGILLISTLPADYDAELLAIHCLGAFLKDAKICATMNQSLLSQVALQTDDGCLVITDSRIGFLITVALNPDHSQLAAIIAKTKAAAAKLRPEDVQNLRYLM